jgi:hypothetical protein
MKKWLAFLLLPFMGVFATDHAINVEMVGVIPSMTQASSFEIDYRIVNGFEGHYVIVNPRIKPLGNGNIHSGLGVGVRTDVDYGIFGFHLACDHSYTHTAHNLQLVPSFEFLGSKWQYNVNAYLPFKNLSAQSPIGQIVHTHRYFNHEVTYKWSIAHLSLSHNFDLEKIQHGYVGKISKDFGALSLALSGGADSHNGRHVKLALVYNLPSGSSRSEHVRVNRSLGAVYDCKVLPMRVPKNSGSTLTVINIDRPTKNQIDNTKKAVAGPDSPIPPVPPKETHWYDIFLNGRSS